MLKPKLRTWWIYNGPGDGHGTRHWVTSNENNEVTTITDPLDGKFSGGWDWLGSVNDFLKHFTPAPVQ